MGSAVTVSSVICPGNGNIRDAKTSSWFSMLLSLLRGLARSVVFWTGALTLYHRLRNRQVLTVATFHRVLNRDDPRWNTALAPWTLDDDIFDRCLVFFKRHYNLVTLEDVKASIDRTRPLPPRSLLVTFDDGFADNFDYALPLLQKHRVPAVFFVTSDVIGRAERLWTEDLLWTFMTGRADQQAIERLYELLIGKTPDRPKDPKLIWEIVRRGPELEGACVASALATVNVDMQRIKRPRQMLTKEEIAELVRVGGAIGAHGKTHTALCFCSNLAAELSSPRETIKNVVASHGQSSVEALSFPHGAYSAEIVDRALASGYSLLFTSDAELCELQDGFLDTPLVGRIDVDGRRIAPLGTFRPEVLATSLFTVAHRRAKPRPRKGLHSQLLELLEGGIRARKRAVRR